MGGTGGYTEAVVVDRGGTADVVDSAPGLFLVFIVFIATKWCCDKLVQILLVVPIFKGIVVFTAIIKFLFCATMVAWSPFIITLALVFLSDCVV